MITCLGVRFLGDEVIAGGHRVDDAVYFGVEFAKAGMDYLSISKGGKFEDAEQPRSVRRSILHRQSDTNACPRPCQTNGAPSADPYAGCCDQRAVNAAGFENAGSCYGGITTFEQAEAIIHSGDATSPAWRARLWPIPIGL